jgi:hypothetical protein
MRHLALGNGQISLTIWRLTYVTPWRQNPALKVNQGARLVQPPQISQKPDFLRVFSMWRGCVPALIGDFVDYFGQLS